MRATTIDRRPEPAGVAGVAAATGVSAGALDEPESGASALAEGDPVGALLCCDGAVAGSVDGTVEPPSPVAVALELGVGEAVGWGPAAMTPATARARARSAAGRGT